MTTNFPPNSRYHGIETSETAAPDGRKIVYLRRRFVPSPRRFALLQEHTVAEGERPDANGVMRPEELTEEVGRRLRITLPEGIPGLPDA